MRHFPILSLVITSLAVCSASASTYIADFSSLSPGEPLVGVDGWTQSHANFDDGEVYPWAFGQTLDGIPAASIGGFYNTDPPTGGNFYASHTLSLVGSMYFEMRFSMTDSLPFDFDGVMYGGERNKFTVGFHTSTGAELFGLAFDPNIDLENPDPVTNLNNTWNVSSSSAGVQSAATMAIIESSPYLLRVSLTPKAGDLNFSYSLSNSQYNRSASGVLVGLTPIEISELRIGITATDDGLGNGPQFGTNFLTFGGAGAAIPEPSSLLLFSLTVGGLTFLRKRR